MNHNFYHFDGVEIDLIGSGDYDYRFDYFVVHTVAD